MDHGFPEPPPLDCLPVLTGVYGSCVAHRSVPDPVEGARVDDLTGCGTVLILSGSDAGRQVGLLAYVEKSLEDFSFRTFQRLLRVRAHPCHRGWCADHGLDQRHAVLLTDFPFTVDPGRRSRSAGSGYPASAETLERVLLRGNFSTRRLR